MGQAVFCHTHNKSLPLSSFYYLFFFYFWDYLCLCEKMHAIDFKEIQEKLSDGFRPWQRSFQFWARASDIYTGYKVSFLLLLLLPSQFFLLCCMQVVKCVALLWFLRYFSLEWASSRMWRNKRNCGRRSMNLLLTKYTLCALTLVVSSLRWYQCVYNILLTVIFLLAFYLFGVLRPLVPSIGCANSRETWSCPSCLGKKTRHFVWSSSCYAIRLN